MYINDFYSMDNIGSDILPTLVTWDYAHVHAQIIRNNNLSFINDAKRDFNTQLLRIKLYVESMNDITASMYLMKQIWFYYCPLLFLDSE